MAPALIRDTSGTIRLPSLVAHGESHPGRPGHLNGFPEEHFDHDLLSLGVSVPDPWAAGETDTADSRGARAAGAGFNDPHEYRNLDPRRKHLVVADPKHCQVSAVGSNLLPRAVHTNGDVGRP